jgi:hypothetical protein
MKRAPRKRRGDPRALTRSHSFLPERLIGTSRQRSSLAPDAIAATSRGHVQALSQCVDHRRTGSLGLRRILDLPFVTRRGACDPTYNFAINVTDGVVTHPNLVRFRGYVARSGAVRASVTVQDKYASGSGRLASNSGRGTWSGYSGSARCSGYWTAQRN